MDYTNIDKNPDFSDAKYPIRNKKQRPHRHNKSGIVELDLKIYRDTSTLHCIIFLIRREIVIFLTLDRPRSSLTPLPLSPNLPIYTYVS